MMVDLSERQLQIYTLLRRRMVLSFGDIQGRFQISLMTAHRDIDCLVKNGLAEKIRGGARLNSNEVSTNQVENCAYCHKPISPRTGFVIHLESQREVHTCCPHCGLLHLSQFPTVVAAMGVDFIYGHRVNVKEATFLAGSAINLCCTPTVLCLDQADDAARLQAGFGGQLLAFPQAIEFVRQAMQVEMGPIDKAA